MTAWPPPSRRLRRWVEFALGHDGTAPERHRRWNRVAQGAVTALASKGISVLVGFASVPLTVGYLGAERYGAWMTLLSLLAWLDVADLGIGSGLTNALSEAHGRGDSVAARRYVATAFWSMVAVAALLGVVVLATFGHVDWAAFLNLHSTVARREIAPAVGWALALFIAAFPLALLDRLYAAQQEGALSNAWGIATNLAGLVALVAVTQTRGGLPALVVALLGTRLTVAIANALWAFGRRHRELRPDVSQVSRTSLVMLARTGGLFFVIQLAAIVLFNTDNVIIARVLGAERVTPYSVAWKLFTVPTLAMTLVFPYLWPAYVEAFARRDVEWVRSTFRATLLASIAGASVLALALWLMGRWIIAALAGADAVPPSALLGWMAVWSVVSSGMNALACLLNASGHLVGQATYGLVTAAMNVVLSLWWARLYGISGVIAATVTAYLLCAVLPSALETRNVLRGLCFIDSTRTM